MRIGFYLDNSKYENIDFSSPQKGNPGIGGTEYMFSLISYYCSKQGDNDIYIFSPYICNLPKCTKNIKATTIKEVIEKAGLNRIDYLVCRPLGNKEYYDLLNKHKVKTVIWGHNYIKFKEMNIIHSCKSVMKYVCVSAEQLKSYILHPIYKKSTFINNSIVKSIYDSKVCKDHSICYIGAIKKSKGFDTCCKIWRKLYDDGIDVKFNVIGSNRLYNSSKQLGNLGLASQEYENVFSKYITDKNNKLLDQVKIYGLLDHNKKMEVINNSRLVVSASKSETFGIVALESIACGKPFVAIKTKGYSTIIENKKTGYLVNNEEELYDKLVEVLKMPEEEYLKMVNNCITKAQDYDVNIAIDEWNKLFMDVKNYKKDIKVTIKDIKNSIKNLLFGE